MTLENIKEKYNSFSKSVDRLSDVLRRDKEDDIVIDAVIQRFEFTYELTWKLLKLILSYRGIVEVRSPRETFKESFASGIITEGNIWIEMLEDRNITSHTYDEEEAEKVYENVKNKYFNLFKILRDNLLEEMKL
jgi:nucleotidyltransferase substrate binding protein (TIGR01987 family)